MSEVVSFKVRRGIKRKMDAYKDKVNWSEELRRFVEERIRELEAQENIARVVEELKRASWRAERGTAARLIRWDRDSH